MESPPLAPLTKSTQRLLILGLILTGWALIVVFRLVQIQVFLHDYYSRIGQSQQQKLEPIEASRGSIFDRNGHYLAISSASQFVVVNPKRIPDKATAAAILARVLNLDADKLQQDIEWAAASKRHSGYWVVDPHVPGDKAEALRALKLDWLEIRQGSFRTYPNGQLAAHVIGNVGGDGKGAAGVELKLDKELAGTPGTMRVKVDVKQRPYASEIAKAPIVGKNIQLTIDSQLQHVAEEALKSAVVDYHADHGSIVAMDPRTGEILALANYPTYDPNERLHAGEKAHGREDLAVVAPFEPGSVFKIITLSAALETTSLRPGSVINCGNGVMSLFGRVIHDHKAHSALSMADVLAFSSNIGAIRIGMEVGNKNLYEYIRRFGFGHRTGIELPAEAPGILRPLKRWQPTSIGSVPMGHELAVTSVQLAQAGSVIANGGFLVRPHLVMWKQAPGESKEVPQQPPPVQILKPENVMTMRQMMERVVTVPGGTGYRRIHLPGYTVAGKTGTAQIYDFAHHVYTHKYNASFLGFAPVVNPSVLVVVTVSGTSGEAGYGGIASSPAFNTVASTGLRLMGVQRDVPQEIEAELLLAEQKKEKEKEKSREKDQENDVDLADFSDPLTDEDMREAMGGSPAANTLAADSVVSGPKVPNFLGKTVKDVMQQAAQQGIDVDLMGDGMARAQSLRPGSILAQGAHVRVRFTR
jgi:cell division protein FtsI (penicillin-binding protein 3)